MKRKPSVIALMFFCVFFNAQCGQKDNTKFHELKGPYLGQKPPGDIPELFAPDLISAGCRTGAIRFSPDGLESIFYVSTPMGQPLLEEPKGVFQKHYIMYTQAEKDRWTEPQELYFDPERKYHYFFISPDGKRIYFNNIVSEDGPPGSGIWYVEKNSSGWTEPQEVDFGVNYKGYGGGYVSVASNGNLYFCRWGSRDKGKIYVSRYQNGKYSMPEVLSDAINDKGAGHPYIAPDESYLLFDRENDLYISFKNINGKWINALNLGERINTEYLERHPFVSFDGKYLFFNSNRINPELPSEPVTLKKIQQLANVPANGFIRVYWIDARVIENLRPNLLK